MAKSLLLSVLVDVLGNYVEGLSQENLKLGVWSGKIELNNLKLKGSGLDSLNLPIEVSRGFLKKLKLKIPWTQLESKPVQVVIDGVFLQAGPLDLTKQSADSLKRALIASKLKLLKQTDGAVLDSLHNEALHEKVKKATYVQQLTTKIVDNIEITLTNVHIRYEDSLSIPGCVFSAGVTIDSISLSTTDANWSVAFITRELQSKVETAIHKLGIMENFGIYWNKNSKSFIDLDYENWEREMQAVIYSNSIGPSTHDMPKSNHSSSIHSINYLLAPPNCLSLKLIHRDTSSESVPKVDVVIESTTLPFQIDSSQYQQLMLLSSSMSELDRRKQNTLMRPKQRPNKDPRGWWKYAYQLVTGKTFSASNKMEMMVKCIKNKDFYMSHVKKSVMVSELGGANSAIVDSLAAGQELLNQIEAELPLNALLVFRQMALTDAVVEIKKCRADFQYAASKGFNLEVAAKKTSAFSFSWGSKKKDEASNIPSTAAGHNKNEHVKEEKKKKGMFSSWFGSKEKESKPHQSIASIPHGVSANAPPALKRDISDETSSVVSDMDADDDQIMESLEAKLGAAAEESSSLSVFSLRINLKSAQTFKMTHFDLPVIFVTMESKAKVEVRLNQTLCNFNMNNMSVEDTCTVSPFNKYLVYMTPETANSEASSPFGSPGRARNTPRAALTTSTKGSLCSVTFENKPGTNKLTVFSSPLDINWNEKCIQKLLAFLSSPGASQNHQNEHRVRSVSRFATTTSNVNASTFDVSVEMYAPKFIIPENCYKNEGIMMLDAGHLVLHGSFHPVNGMQLNIALKAVNIGMPLERVEFVDEGLYLIKPFDISLNVENMSKVEADLCVDLKVLPHVKGELDAVKIGRMLCVANVLSRSFDTSSVIQYSRDDDSDEDETSANSKLAKKNAIVVDNVTSQVIIDAARAKVVLKMSCPEISVELAISKSHSVTYAYLDINAVVVQREYDLSIGLGVKSFLLNDSMRPQSCPSILWTPHANNSSDVITVSYRALNAKASPLYNGNKSELSVTMTKICLGMDEASTLRFKPFVVELVDNINKNQSRHPRTTPARRRSSANLNQLNSGVSATSNVDPLGGMFIMFALESVEVHLLSVVPAISPTNLIDNDLLASQTYETAFKFDCEGLFAEMNLKEFKEIHAHLKSFGIVDKRKISDKFFYNSLINKSIITRDNIDTAADDDKNILSFDMTQMSLKSQHIEISLQNVTSMISVDMALDFATLLIANANAASKVVEGFSRDEKLNQMAHENAQRVKTMVRSSIVASSANVLVAANKLKANAKEKSEVEEETSTLVVSFKLLNPKLLLIENPEDEHSKAIVSNCQLSMQYIRELKDRQQEVRESLHFALEHAEVLVVTDTKEHTSPHQIIEPTAMNIYLKRTTEKGKVLSNQLTLSTETISSRVSLNDIVLATSIIARASLVQTSGKVPADDAAMAIVKSKNDEKSKSSHAGTSSHIGPKVVEDEGVSLSLYKLQVNLAQINFMLINDFNSENIPIARVSIDDAEFNASGISQQLSGEGGLIMSSEYYNVSVAAWEPLLETWQPSLTMELDFDSISFDLSSPHTVQLNLSGAFCKCLYNASWLMTQIGKEGSYGKRHVIHPLSVRNLLGVPVDLVDSHTQFKILTLLNNDLQVVPAVYNTTSGSRRASPASSKYSKQLINHPDLFDVFFIGKFGEERMPLLQMPLYINRPRPYVLHQTHSPDASSRSNVYSESIVEEAYQNQRYYPLKGAWADPWPQLNDCAAWTDIRGREIKDKKYITVPAGWQWVETDWRVDLNGVSKGEIDSEGFEYGAAFNAFSHAKKRRSKQPLDVVRRRRWIRTRAPVQNSQSETLNSRPLTVVWDVKTRSDGSREIKIRSGVQVRNEMPFDIDVDVVDASASSGAKVTAACVAEGKLYSVPLLQSHFNYMNFRPAVGHCYAWSDNVYCKSNESFIIQCTSPECSTIFMRVSIQQQDKSLLVVVSPNAIIFNRLPCSMSYFLADSTDSGELAAGGQSKVVLVDFSSPVDVAINVLPYISTYTFRVASSADVKDQELILCTPDESSHLTVTMSVQTNQSTNITEISLYSKYALVDFSHSNLVTRTKRHDVKNAKITNASDCIERYSYHPSDIMHPSVDPNTNYWAIGSHGFTLFQTLQHKFSLGVEGGLAWVNDISLDSLEASKSTLEVAVPSGKHAYNLAFTVSTMIGAYSSTQILTVMPAYVLVNCMDEQLSLIQAGSNVAVDDVVHIEARQTSHWHKRNAKAGTSVFLKCASTGWSLGTVDLNDIGSTAMILPQSDLNFSYGSDLFVVHIEVKLSDKVDLSYITVVIWRSQVKKFPRYQHLLDASSCALSVRNESELPVVVEQSGISVSYFGDASSKLKFDLCVPPGSWQAYGWAFPDDKKTSLSVAIGTSTEHLQGALRVIDTLKIGEVVALDMSELGVSGVGDLRMVINTLSNGKVLRIYSEAKESTIKSSSLVASRDIVFKCSFTSIGFSLVSERPHRCEFFSMYVDHLEVILRKSGNSPNNSFSNAGCSSVEFRVMDIQVDNYSESMVFPVLVNSVNGTDRINAEKAKQRKMSIKSSGEQSVESECDNEVLYFLEFTAVKEDNIGQTTTVLKYVAFRMLDAKICVDSSTLFLYLCDIHSDLSTNNAGIDLSNDPNAVILYINNVNNGLLSRQNEAANLEKVYQLAQASKIYFESFVIHPIRLKLTFTPSKCPRTQKALNKIPGYRSLKRIQSVTSVDEFEIKINSFQVEYAMESISTLQSRIIAKIIKDIQDHLVQIAGSLFGSLSMLGKPAGLAKNIGGGVQDFFYEPYMGMMQSPTGFVKGIGKGTSSLVSGVAGGVITSAATIVGSATGSVNSVAKSVVNMTGDRKYVKQREEKRREARAGNGGVVGGFKAGGESIVSGFTSGLSGLVTKPYEEGKKGGAVGFFKGVGMGLVGAAVKPVLGVSDGLANVAQGFSQQVNSDLAVVSHVRPPRAFERSSTDPNDVILINVDLFSAEAQQAILKRASKKDYKDRYHHTVLLGYDRSKPPYDTPFAIAISDVYIFLLSKEVGFIWLVPFGEISHFVFRREDPNSIELVVYRSSSASLNASTPVNAANLYIPCASRGQAIKVYSLLFHYSHRMGNPGNVAPVEVASGESSRKLEVGDINKVEGSRSSAATEYVFGTVNAKNVQCKVASDKDILNMFASKLSHIEMPVELSDKQKYFRALDEAVWELICMWKHNHGTMWNMSRCAACVIINNSKNYVQILKTELKEGLDVNAYGVSLGYDRDSRSILPNGGAVVIFTYGYLPTLTDLAHVKIVVNTSVFQSMISTRKDRTTCTNEAGGHAGFSEKTQTDTWAKSVISISQ